MMLTKPSKKIAGCTLHKTVIVRKPTAKKPVGTLCRYWGASTGKFAPCRPGCGETRIIHLCLVHEKCTLKQSEDASIMSCDRCQHGALRGYAPTASGNCVVFDEKNLFPEVGEKRFNSSLVRDAGGWVLAFRTGWKGSDIYLGRLDDRLLPTGHAHRLDLRHQFSSYGREDPRLFLVDGKIWCSFIGVAKAGNIWTSQLYAKLNDQWQVTSCHAPDYQKRNAWEKNWGFFHHNGQLYAVYSITPHRILKIDDSNAALTHETSWNSAWTMGEMRSGAAPFLVGNEYYCFFHSSIRHSNHRYFTGCYTFEARPPFRVTRVTRDPILAGNSDTKPDDQWAAVVFTCGAVLHNNEWVLSSGVHDRWTQIDRFSFSEIEAKLRSVS